MGIEIVFFIKALFFGLAAITLIPKELYKKFFIYGLIFGGLGDFLIVAVAGGILHHFEYRQMGVFNLFNMTSFWTPIAWVFVKMFFLYGLPVRRLFFLLYVPCFGFFGYCVGLVLQNFGLFHYFGVYKYIAPFILTGWFGFSAWAYLKLENIELKKS